MTDLDDLKTLWAATDHKLDACLRLNRRLLDEQRLGRARTALAGFVRTLRFELAGNAIAIAVLAAFAAANPEARFVAPAVLLALGAIALISADVRQLALATVAPDEPIAAAQRRIETLRRMRATRVRWTLFAAPLAWPPLAIVLVKALVDGDVWTEPAWLAANLAFGLVVLVVAWRLSVRYRESRSPWLARMSDALSGRSLGAAQRALRDLAELAG